MIITMIAFTGCDEGGIQFKPRYNPTTYQQTSTTTTTKTGVLDQHGEFPFTIEFTSDNTEQKIPKGTKIHGKNIINKNPQFISIDSPNMSEMMKETVLKSMSSVTEQIDFPSKKLKKGDSFTQETPFTYPCSQQHNEYGDVL